MIVPLSRKTKISSMRDIRLDAIVIECKREFEYHRNLAGRKPSILRWLYIKCWKVAQVIIRNTLDKVQRLACVYVAGGMKTCSIAAVEVILDPIPLNIVVCNQGGDWQTRESIPESQRCTGEDFSVYRTAKWLGNIFSKRIFVRS